MADTHVLVVGAGIYGTTAALELRVRGFAVTLLDPGPIPHPLAASTDISKVCRMEYGADEDYMGLMEQAREGWLDWNSQWVAQDAEPLYHETGVIMVCREPMAEGGFVLDIEVRREGVLVGTQTASLAPCREDTLYREILSGRVPNDGAVPDFVVQPVWEADPPTVTAVEVAISGAPARRYGREILASQARVAIQELTDAGVLVAGEQVEWSVAAREQEATPARFGGRVLREPMPLEPVRLPDVAEGAFEVEIDAKLLSRFREQFVATGATERAWMLTGRVLHDVERAAVRLRVRGAVDVAVGRGGASRTHFAFSEPTAASLASEIGPSLSVPPTTCTSHSTPATPFASFAARTIRNVLPRWAAHLPSPRS